jgi:hypothetical protein
MCVNNAPITGSFLFSLLTGRYFSVTSRMNGRGTGSSPEASGCYRGLRGTVQMGLQELWCQAHLAGVRESICLACRDKHRQSQSIVENCCYIQVNSSARHHIPQRQRFCTPVSFVRFGFVLWFPRL